MGKIVIAVLIIAVSVIFGVVSGTKGSVAAGGPSMVAAAQLATSLDK